MRLILFILILCPFLGSAQEYVGPNKFKTIDQVIQNEGHKFGHMLRYHDKVSDTYQVMVFSDSSGFIRTILVVSDREEQKPFYWIDELPISSHYRLVDNYIIKENYFEIHYSDGESAIIKFFPNPYEKKEWAYREIISGAFRTRYK